MTDPKTWMVVYDSLVKMHLALGSRRLRSYERLVDEGLLLSDAYEAADRLNVIRDVDAT